MKLSSIFQPQAAVVAFVLLFITCGISFAQSRSENPLKKHLPDLKPTVSAADLTQSKPHYFLPKQKENPFAKPFEPMEVSEPAADAHQPLPENKYKTADKITDIIKAPSNYAPGRSSGRWVIPDGATEYGVEFGFAPQVATWMSGPKYYDTSDRQHLLGSVRWGKILGTRAFVTYSWAIEIQPINIALGNEVDNPRYLAGSVGEPRRNYEATYGVGINPASFRFIFFPQYRLRPMLGAGFGVVRHLKRVPTVEGTKFNFQADFHIGAQYMIKENKALNFGYRYYHLSNLYLFNFNPGYNVNMFFVGYSVFK